MTVGDGIFFGLVFASLVALYIATKDRWRWRRLAKWVLAICALPFVAGGAWVGYDQWTQSRPRLQTDFWDLRPGMSIEEVTFRKGQPTQKADGYWAYLSDAEKVGYVIGFRDGRVRYVEAITRQGDSVYLPTLQGISSFSTSDDLVGRFGQPDGVSTYEDGMRRQLSFSRFGLTFQLERNRVIGLGVFDPTHGPVRFGKEAATPKQ